MIIKDVMKKPVVVDGDVSLEKASAVMSKEEISSLIIVEGTAIIGIITEEDLVEHFGKDKKVSEIMSNKVVTIHDDAKTPDAVELMREHKIGVLPVVDKDGKLVGVITNKDLLAEGGDDGDFLIG